MAAIGNATRHSFLVREGDALERLAQVGKAAFDKTGTLTRGVPEVTAVRSLSPGVTEEQVYAWLARAEPVSYTHLDVYKRQVLWYRKSAEEGYAPGQCNLAVCYLNGNGVERDAAAAVRWLEKAAAQGNARAQSILGDLCRDGEGTEMDAARAFQLYTQAAEQGYPPAQCALGYCYEVGSGTAEDKTKAVEWYEKAADVYKRQGQIKVNMIRETKVIEYAK